MDPERVVVKRVIALAGDEVATRPPYPEPRCTVPWGHVWVEGDNQDPHKTLDSNAYGPIQRPLIMGRVRAVVFPWAHAARIRWQDWTGAPNVTPNKQRMIAPEIYHE